MSEQFNIFSMFNQNEEIKKFNEEVKKEQQVKEAAKKEETKKEENSKPKKTSDQNTIIKGQLNKFTKVIVKAWGNELECFDTPEEIEAIDLNELSRKLIEDWNYGEFGEKVKWSVAESKDKLTGYLLAIPPFKSKG